MPRYTRLQDMSLKGRRVFVRVDLNVPLKREGDHLEVVDATRIDGALPTIQFIMEAGGKVILASHLGRPKAKPEPKYSLEPVGRVLSQKLGKDVILTDSCIGDGARGLSRQLRDGAVLLLENLRFEPGEEANSPDFCQKLQDLCECYVSDAFGTLHRAHASTAGLARLFEGKDRGMGLLVQKELEYLQPLRDDPAKPFVLVMGGAKVSDKIGVLEHFLPKVNTVAIGGAMAYAFLKAKGFEVGDSFCKDEEVNFAARVLRNAHARNVEILLPVDHIIARNMDDVDGARATNAEAIPEGFMGLDIGPRTVEKFAQAFETAETIFWNGPMGVFEKPAFAKGTFELARHIGRSKARKLAGGGDVAAAIAASGCESQFDFISTGGGATLEFLEGKGLPGLKVLDLDNRLGI
jgi:phosphoglycerate kinase